MGSFRTFPNSKIISITKNRNSHSNFFFLIFLIKCYYKAKNKQNLKSILNVLSLKKFPAPKKFPSTTKNNPHELEIPGLRTPNALLLQKVTSVTPKQALNQIFCGYQLKNNKSARVKDFPKLASGPKTFSLDK
jgi:hypothetical protein